MKELVLEDYHVVCPSEKDAPLEQYVRTDVRRFGASDYREARALPILMEIGFREDGSSAIQSYLFPRELWKLEGAQAWVADQHCAAPPEWKGPDIGVVTEGTMDKSTVKEAEWTTAYINDLPDSAFAYIEPGGTKDEQGKTTPRSKRHFPIKDANGKPDAAHVRNALSRAPQSPFGAKALPKIRAAAKALGIGQAAKEGDVSGADGVEGELSLVERIDGITSSRVDRAARTVYGAALLNSHSRNQSRSGQGHRYYPAGTMRQAEPMFEGIQLFVNHPEEGTEGKVRDVREILGMAENVRTEDYGHGTATLRGNIKAVPGSLGDWFLGIAEAMPGIAGFSINASGKLRDDNGNDVVESFTVADSIDFVSKPGATSSIFESLRGSHAGAEEKKDMEKIKELEGEVTKLKEAQAAEAEKAKTLETENKVLKDEKAKHEREAALEKAIKEAGLEPAAITPVFREVLLGCEKPEKLKELLEDRKAAIEHRLPESHEERILGDGERELTVAEVAAAARG